MYAMNCQFYPPVEQVVHIANHIPEHKMETHDAHLINAIQIKLCKEMEHVVVLHHISSPLMTIDVCIHLTMVRSSLRFKLVLTGKKGHQMVFHVMTVSFSQELKTKIEDVKLIYVTAVIRWWLKMEHV